MLSARMVKSVNPSAEDAQLKLSIPKHFYEKSDLWGARASLRLLGIPLLWIGLLPTLYSISPWLAVLAIIPLGVAISKTTILVHEAVHGTLFKTPILNQFVGRVGGWWTVVDFAAFDVLHRKHHAHVGDDHDPQLLDYSVLDGVSSIQLGWHLARPLIGWNVLHMLTMIKQRLSMHRSWFVSIGEMMGLVIVQIGFFLLATAGGSYWWLGMIFPIAAMTIGLTMAQIRGFCEHIPMPGEDAKMRLRSHDSHFPERLFMHYMNYNYHGEHHLFPRIPSRNLPAFSRWLSEQGWEVEQSPSYLSTILARWRAC